MLLQQAHLVAHDALLLLLAVRLADRTNQLKELGAQSEVARHVLDHGREVRDEAMPGPDGERLAACELRHRERRAW